MDNRWIIKFLSIVVPFEVALPQGNSIQKMIEHGRLRKNDLKQDRMSLLNGEGAER